ncbi:MAG: hypothetical protein J7K15_07655, partial [Deltaproteobacteria bacterium]|nr:hypothetical protein [Deltaproteobacteria bacterium]
NTTKNPVNFCSTYLSPVPKHKVLSSAISNTWIRSFQSRGLSLSVKNAVWYWEPFVPAIHQVFTESQFSYLYGVVLKILGKELILCYIKGLIVVFFRLKEFFYMNLFS